jgi:hypothetical protein
VGVQLPGQLTEAQFEANPDAAHPVAITLGLGRDEVRFRLGARMEQGLNAAGSVKASAYYSYGGRTFAFRYPGDPPGVLNLNLHRSQFGAQVSAMRVGGGPVGIDCRHRIRRRAWDGSPVAERRRGAGPDGRRRH